MQRRTNLQISSLIILLSIITILTEFAIYYFFSAFYIILGFSVIINIIFCHILLEQTAAYEACFLYSVLNLFISSIIIMLSYYGKDQSFLPYSITMLWIAILNWFIPCIYCFIRNMLDYGTRFEDFNIFFRNDSILFFVLYLGFLLYTSFAKDAFLWIHRGSLNSINFMPFEAITIQIEDYLYGMIPLSDIITYLLWRILLFMPYGFQMTLLLRKKSRIIRLAILLAFPLLIEVLQYFFLPSRFDVDDILYALIGGILGAVVFYLCNLLFRTVTGKDFLTSDSNYHYNSSHLHF